MTATYGELLRFALEETDDVGEALAAVELAVAYGAELAQGGWQETGTTDEDRAAVAGALKTPAGQKFLRGLATRIGYGESDLTEENAPEELWSEFWQAHTSGEGLRGFGGLGKALQGIAARAESGARPAAGMAFAHDVHDPRAQKVLDKALKAARVLSASARKELAAAFKLAPQEAAPVLSEWLTKYRLQLSQLLSGTQLAALLEGAREVAGHLPVIPAHAGAVPPPPTLPPEKAVALLEKLQGLEGMKREEAIYALPPAHQEYARAALAAGESASHVSPPVPAPFVTGPGRVHLETIEEAARVLTGKNVVRDYDFPRMSEAARQKAFTVAGADSMETMAKVRDLLAENVEGGASLADFQKAVEEEGLGGTFLSDAHLETVFRTNVQAAFSDGQMSVLRQPYVRSGFPYARYDAIHDGRVRANHLALETLGIDGTNVYRIDDPVFESFRPPWDYQDRCGWVPTSVEQAARMGVKEAQAWLESGVEPSPPARVPWPDFRPPEAFRRSVSAAPLSVQLSLLPLNIELAQGDWTQTGTQDSRGFPGWQNRNTGEVRYQKIPPESRRRAGPEQPAQPAPTPPPRRPYTKADLDAMDDAARRALAESLGLRGVGRMSGPNLYRNLLARAQAGEGQAPAPAAPQAPPAPQPPSPTEPIPPAAVPPLLQQQAPPADDPDDPATPLRNWARAGLRKVLANPRPDAPPGMASIADLRRELQARGGMRQRFDETLKDLYYRGEVRLIGPVTSDYLRPGDREEGIPGVNETFVWVELQRPAALAVSGGDEEDTPGGGRCAAVAAVDAALPSAGTAAAGPTYSMPESFEHGLGNTAASQPEPGEKDKGAGTKGKGGGTKAKSAGGKDRPRRRRRRRRRKE